MVDMDLTHFFLTKTFATIQGMQERRLVWRDTVFQEAIGYPPLMDGLLASAALHKIAIGGAKATDLQHTILQKQTSTVQGLSGLLGSFDKTNCEHIFLMAALVTMWALASLNLPDGLGILSLTPDLGVATHVGSGSKPNSVIDAFILLHQRIHPLQEVIRRGRPWLVQGRFRELLRQTNVKVLRDLSSKTLRALEELEQCCAVHSEGTLELALSDSHFTFQHLFQIATCPGLHEAIVAWAIDLPPRFVDRLKERDHAAVSILSYWAACFHALNGRWWAQGWAVALIQEAQDVVEGPWRRIVEWPASVIQEAVLNF